MKKTSRTIPSVQAAIALAVALAAANAEPFPEAKLPTAGSPQFDQREIWPDLVGDEYFLNEQWPAPTRVLVWAHPDEGNGKDPSKHDHMEPANWIDAATGRPAGDLPDETTDVILPDAKNAYSVQNKDLKGIRCRHLTIGKNAYLRTRGLSLDGNLWIKPHGGMWNFGTLNLTGVRHTFVRYDWQSEELRQMHRDRTVVPFDPDNPKSQPWKASVISQYLYLNKPGKSAEVRGFVSAGDEIKVMDGTLIVGRDSRLLGGRNSHPLIETGGIIALMDGSLMGKWTNEFYADYLLKGAITGGLPDRPLQRDAFLGLGYKNWMNIGFAGQESLDAKKIGQSRMGYGYSALEPKGPKSSLIGYPAPGSDAKLVVGWHRIASWNGYKLNETDEFFKDYMKLQPKITLMLPATVKNVRFEDLHRGGIITGSKDLLSTFKSDNVTFGEGNLSENPEDLIRIYEGRTHAGRAIELEAKPEYTSM